MNLDRIANLLSSGLKPTQVSTIVGCTPARISQLLKDSEELQLLLAEKNSALAGQNLEEESLSNKYTAAEHTLIQQMMELAPVSEMRDVTNALRVVADRQEKMKSRINPVVQPSQVVNLISLSLPSHALPQPSMRMTENKEVISIGERNLAPLSATAVTQLFSKMRTIAEQTVIEGEHHVPSPSSSSTKASPAEVSIEESFLSHASA